MARRLSNSWFRISGLAALIFLLLGSSIRLAAAPGDVMLMPARDAFMGSSIVVWGNAAAPNGSAFTLDYGDTTSLAGNYADQSYIFANHTYAAAGTYTVTLTVGADSATTTVTVWDSGTLSAENLRRLKINMAIEDGLRYLYAAQDNRAATFGTNLTSWFGGAGNGENGLAFTSLAVLAFQNHGHSVLNDPTMDIFQPVVQRGLNTLFDNMAVNMLTIKPNVGLDDSCVNVEAAPCVGLGSPAFNGLSGYSSSVRTLAVAAAAAAAPGRTVGLGIGAAPACGSGPCAPYQLTGKTYAEILQRMVDNVAWGMGSNATYAGGFGYQLTSQQGDGSAEGWGILALLDGEAGGATLPMWVRPEVASTYLPAALNTDGSLKYQLGYPDNQSNFPKTGIGLETMFFAGRPAGNATVLLAEGLLSTNWASGFTTDGFIGGNKGHSYGMFNAFKGLKLYGVATLPGVGRAAGPGAIPANDWYEDYRDFLIASQVMPTDPGSGYWDMQWSYCGPPSCNNGGGLIGGTAVAELILSPTALVLPAHLVLSPPTATNPQGTTHTVTVVATTNISTPVAGATVTFTVVSGPNSGTTGSAVTDGTGTATFTYTDTGGAGTDTIQANIGNLQSNSVEKIWQGGGSCDTLPTLTCTNVRLPKWKHQWGHEDEDDLFKVQAANQCTPGGPVTITLGATSIPNGSLVNIEESRRSGVWFLGTRRGINYFVAGKGPATLTATDPDGNTATVQCIEKEEEHHHRGDGCDHEKHRNGHHPGDHCDHDRQVH